MEEDLEKELQELIDAADKEREEELKDDSTSDDTDNTNSDSTDDDDSTSDDGNDLNEEEDIDDSEDDDSDNDNSDDDDSDDSDEDDELKFEPIEIELNGNKVTINSQEELMTLAKKGLDSVNIVPNSDSEIDTFAKQGKLSKDDLTLLIDAKNGDVNAIAKLAKLGNIDVLDIEAENADKYKPSFELSVESDVEKVAGNILADTEHAKEFQGLVSRLPSDFIDVITGDASKLSAFSSHIKRGLAQKIIPLVQKEQALNGGTFFDNYAKIGIELAKAETNTTKDKTEAKKEERVMSEKEKKLRERANSIDKSESSSKKKTTADDIHNMSDEEFAKLTAPK